MTNKPYISQKGFVLAPVYRGFDEIRTLYDDVLYAGGLVCGGYVRYMCSPATNPAPASDVDIYCPTEEVYDKIKKLFDGEMEVKFENDISLTYKRVAEGKYFPSPIVQLIKPTKEGSIVTEGMMDSILENFDFTVVRCGLINRYKAIVDADFEHDEKKQILRLKNIHCPISSLLRCLKYAKKGYWMPPMHTLPLFLDWENRDEDYRAKIIDYLESANEGKGLTEEEVNELEALMRID